jgi:hypothetical protein
VTTEFSREWGTGTDNDSCCVGDRQHVCGTRATMSVTNPPAVRTNLVVISNVTTSRNKTIPYRFRIAP